MAGAETSEKPVFSLKLLVDKKKSKVVLAEASKDFVDVLFGLLELPMGTIVRLLEKYQQNQKNQAATIGCFNTLYKSVFDLETDNFSNGTCKDMLLIPRSVTEKQYRRPKLNMDDTFAKYYGCPNLVSKSSCPRIYSYFCSSVCICGKLMEKELKINPSLGGAEIFASDKNLFTITDKMDVGFTSMGLTLKILKDLGYADADKLEEMIVDVDHDKVLALLQCLFCSDTALTDVFLTRRMSRTKPSLPLQEEYKGTSISTGQMSISVFTRKVDNKVLYVESGKDFVDLLFTFLALPLYSAWAISGSSIALGCIGNLCGSFRILMISSSQWKTPLTGCILPWYYNCGESLLGVSYTAREDERQVLVSPHYYTCCLIGTNLEGGGFVKKGKMFMVLDGLIITPMNLTSNICHLKKWNINLDDIEEHVINISSTEAVSLLRASFMTSTALNTVFGSLLPKKPKQEKV